MDDQKAVDNRKDLRFRTRFDALYTTGPSEGAGVLVDLSYSGALLDGVTFWPEIGTQVRFYVFVQPVQPFEVIGHVVRHTDTGFAIQYDLSDSEIRHLVDDVSAMVILPGS